MENTSNDNGLNLKIRNLQESEEQFRNIVEHSNEAIVVAQDETVKYCNPRFIGLTGYTPEEISARNFIEFIHPEDREIVSLEYRSRLSGKRPTANYSVRIITKNGQEKHIFVNSALVTWDGKPAALAMLTDITELKVAEKEILKSEEHFRNLMEQSPLGIIIYTPDGRIAQVNSAWMRLWGVDELQTAQLKAKFNILTDPQLKELGVMPLIEKAFAGEYVVFPPIKYSGKHVAEDLGLENMEPSTVWHQNYCYSIMDEHGAVAYVVIIIMDITDLKETEEQLRKGEERFRRLMEFSPLGIAIYQPDGKISQVNNAFNELWGFSEEEVAQVIGTYNILADEQIKNLGNMRLVERAFKGESVILPPMEYVGKRTMENLQLEDIEAKSRLIQTHLYSVKDTNGEIDYVVVINMDLTELKRAERDALEQRESVARMDRATRLGQLTGSIAHELNQPLTGILSNAQAAELLINNNQIESAEFKMIISDIVADTKRAGEIIRNLRDLFREHKGEHVPIDVNSIVEDAKKLLHSEFVMKQVKIDFSLALSLPPVNGNRLQLQQVLVNLIMNSEQAMSDMEKEDRKILIFTRYEKNRVKVWVDDFGPGIDDEKIDHVFEPLATWKSGGTGMGLAIGNSIIEAHGGKMWAENRKGGGARVGFALPVLKKDNKT